MRVGMIVRFPAIVAVALALAMVSGCVPAQVPTRDNPSAAGGGTMTMELTSPAFGQGGVIPPRFAMRAVPGGENVSIPYTWVDAPAATRSFALVLVDRAPIAHNWVHWLVTDLPTGATALAERASGSSAMPAGARELDNTYGSRGYGGPQPPAGSGPHPYEAKLYALDVASLGLPARTSLAEFERAVSGHTLATATYTGVFSR